MDINKNLRYNKAELLAYFRSRANEILSDLALQYSAADYKKKASALNKAIIQSRDNLLDILNEKARTEKWTNSETLECVLMITYTNDVVMLESRNSVWEYDYMAFSRRVGELWEPFCKLCFKYPSTRISAFVPPLFSEVKESLTSEITTYIDALRIKVEEKEQLKRYYDKVWNLVTSGNIYIKGKKFHAVTPQATVWFDGKTQWTYMKQNDEVNVSNPTEEELQAINPYNFINIYKKGFKLSSKTVNNSYEVHLKATNKKRNIQEMYIIVDKNSYRPTHVKMLQNGQWSVLIISGLKTTTLSDGIFQFNTKDFPQAEVIDLR